MFLMANAGLSLLNSIGGIMGGKSQSKIDSIMAEATAYAQNKKTEGDNLLRATQADIARQNQLTQNNNVLRSAANILESTGINQARNIKSYQKALFEKGIRNTEMLGRAAAEGAFMARGGNVDDIIENTMRLKASREYEDADSQHTAAMYDSQDHLTKTLRNAADANNLDYISEEREYSQAIALKPSSNIFADAVSIVGSGLDMANLFAKKPAKGPSFGKKAAFL